MTVAHPKAFVQWEEAIPENNKNGYFLSRATVSHSTDKRIIIYVVYATVVMNLS